MIEVVVKRSRYEELPVEFVERKGKGHPDSICDRAAEELSIGLSRYYLENFGRILHHNVDKCVLAGGQANAYFGGGEVLEPMYLLFVGRAVTSVGDGGKKVPIGRIAIESTREWIRKEFRFLDPDRHLIIDYKIKPGSIDLIKNFDMFEEIPLANDTSFAVAFAPLSETEKLVFETERLLNSKDFKERLPEVGEDIKVMGMRRGDRIRLTISTAIISSLVPNERRYMEVKDEVKAKVIELANKLTDREVAVQVNTADNPAEGVYYLTVTGTSAEQGDDGQVGRGNRANGLITPFRPMTLEATAGKNPLSHVGKIYNIAARLIADGLIKEEPRIDRAYCYMLSQIGKPITEPQAVFIEAYGDVDKSKVEALAEPITEEVLGQLPSLWERIIKREFRMF
jgi:S-adenosylmethionine synthetase